MQPYKEGSGVPRQSLWECISGAVCRMLRRDVLTRGGAWVFRFRWGVGLLVFALLVFGKVHGFSLGAWDVLFPDATAEYSFPSVGAWRAIRSDEWRVSTPVVLAQCAHPDFFPRINDRIGGGMDMFLAMPACPVWDWTVIGQAHNWGYFLFGTERGLAWNWWIRYLGIFLLALEFFLIWTGGDKSLAIVGALAICWGAPTQWWDTSVPYLLLYFFAGLVCLYRLIVARRPIAQWLWGVGLLVAFCSYAYSFYPPWQFQLGGLWILLAADMVRRAWPCGGNLCRAAIVWVVVLGLGAADLIYFLHIHQETMDVIRHSVYPGSRLLHGVDGSALFEYFTYPLLCLFTSFREMRFMNPCMISMFAAPLMALAFLCIGVLWRRRSRPPWLGLGLLFYAGMLAVGVLWPWSGTMAQWAGTLFVAPNRVAMVMGLVFLLLAFKTFDYCRRRELRASWPWIGVWLAASLVVQLLAFRSHPQLVDYFRNPRPWPGTAMLVLGAGVFLLMGTGLLRANRGLFLGGYLACSLLTGAFVHPLCVGASPLLHKQVAVHAEKIQREFGVGRWLANEKSRAQLLIANGLACVNGIHFAAQRSLWLAIDPARKQEAVWNRYAHVSADIVPGNESLAVLAGRDQFTWKLCRNDLVKLGVRYLLWTNDDLREPWAHPLGRVGRNYFYRIADAGSDALGAGHEF